MVPFNPATAKEESFLKVRIDAVYSIAFAMIGMDVLGMSMIAGLLWRLGNTGWLSCWVVASVLVITARTITAHAYRSGQWPGVSTRVWAAMLVALSGANGALWGAALFHFVASGTDNEVMFVVCVALSGLTVSIANIAYWPVYVAFELPVMIAAASGFALADKPGHWMLAGAASVMTIALLGTSKRLSRYVLQAHRLAATNQALIDSLGERGRELELACDALERVSNTDPLTGLANRRARDMRLADVWARGLRNGGSVAVIAIDVDHFKLFNDTYGHAEGDRALKAVADMLQAGIRGPLDLATRHGGEEFMLILPGVDLAAAASIAERVRVMVAKCHDDPAIGLPQKITVSCGVAAMDPAAGRSLHELTIAADAALYQAKLGGRNRYEVATIDQAAA